MNEYHGKVILKVSKFDGANKPVLIRVKKNHIARGIPNTGNFCPVALALKDAGYKFPNVHVGGKVAEYSDLYRRDAWYKEIRGDPRTLFAVLPNNVREFVEKFDETGEGEPFKFYLNATSVAWNVLPGNKGNR